MQTDLKTLDQNEKLKNFHDILKKSKKEKKKQVRRKNGNKNTRKDDQKVEDLQERTHIEGIRETKNNIYR